MGDSVHRRDRREHPVKHVYLGDSVYAQIDEFGRVVLTTDNGYPDDPRNLIVLEPEVYDALQRFINANKTAEPPPAQ